MKTIAAILLLVASGAALGQGYGQQAQQAASQAAAAAQGAATQAEQAIRDRLPTPNPQEAKISAGISPPSNVTRFRDSFSLQLQPGQSLVLAHGFPPEAGVLSVSLNLVPGQGQDSVSVTVERRGNGGSPAGTVPPGAVHSYIEVTPNASTFGGTVQAKVDCQWLQALGVPDAAMRLRAYHLGPGGWEALVSRALPDPSGCILVEFDTPSFSWFAVAVEPQETIPLTNIPRPAPGFEAVFAVAGLLASAYLVNRRRE